MTNEFPGADPSTPEPSQPAPVPPQPYSAPAYGQQPVYGQSPYTEQTYNPTQAYPPAQTYQPGQGYNPAQPYTAPDPYGAPQASGYYPPPPGQGYPALPPTKSRKGLWIGLSITLVVILVAAIAAVALLGKKSNTSAQKTSPTSAISSAQSTAPTSTGAAQTSTAGSSGTDDTEGTQYTSTAGHFQATFPSQPEEKSVPQSFGGVQMNVVYAVAADPVTEVASESLSQSLPSSQYQTALRAAINSAAAGGELTVTSQHQTTFQGHQARTATLTTPAGEQLTAMFVVYSPTRLYFLLTESSNYDTLAASFQALP